MRPSFVANVRFADMKGKWGMISPTFPESITHLRPLGGSIGMTTFFEGRLPPEAIANPELRQKISVIGNEDINQYCGFVKEKELTTLYMVNVNDTVDNSLFILDKFIAGNANIEIVELANELHLPKFRAVNGPFLPGYVRQITWNYYANYCVQIIPLIRERLPNVKIILCAAYETYTGGTGSRAQWNNHIKGAIKQYPGMVDGVAIHIYEGPKNTSNEEEVFDVIDFSRLDDWDIPIYFTEAGHFLSNYTEEGLAIYKDFHRRMFEYCRNRGDGSMPGTHSLYQRKANKGAGVWGALYNEDGLLPLATKIAGFPFEPVIEPPIEEPPVVDNSPKLEYLSQPTPAQLTQITWTQFLKFRGANNKVIEKKLKGGKFKKVDPLPQSTVGKTINELELLYPNLKLIS